VWEGGGARSGGEEFGLSEVEVYAMWQAKFLKAFDVKDDIAERKDNGGVIEERHGSSKGTLVVIAWGGEEALTGTGKKFGLEGAEDFVKDQASEKRAKGATLGETFVLEEEGPGAAVVEVPTVVGRAVDDVEEREELGKVGEKGLAAGVSGARVKHVDDVKCEEEAGVVLGSGDVTGDQEVEEMGNGIDAALNRNAKLASGEEVGSKRGAEVRHDDGACDTTPAGADTDGPKFERVQWVFLKGKEVVCAKG
jgi:hypothetical protein